MVLRLPGDNIGMAPNSKVSSSTLCGVVQFMGDRNPLRYSLEEELLH